jgi:hypothetical protein
MRSSGVLVLCAHFARHRQRINQPQRDVVANIRRVDQRGSRPANQRCSDEGPLTLERSKTVDEETSAKVIDFTAHGFQELRQSGSLVSPDRLKERKFLPSSRRVRGPGGPEGPRTASCASQSPRTREVVARVQLPLAMPPAHIDRDAGFTDYAAISHLLTFQNYRNHLENLRF